MRFNIILGLLAVILAVPCWLTIEEESVEDFVDPNAIPMLFPGFSADPVMIVEIKRRLSEDQIKAQNLPPEQQFEGVAFQRTGEGWVLANEGPFKGLKMDAELIERDILEHVLDLRLDRETLVPQENISPEFRVANQLTVETGLTIRCLGQPTAANLPPPELAHLILGKSTRRGGAGETAVSGYYVCNPAHPREVVIYEPKSGDWVVSLRPSDWADKKIHVFLRSEVDTFYIQNALGSMGFKLTTAGRWEPVPEQCKAGSEPIDMQAVGKVKQVDVDDLLSKFASLRAESFLRGKIVTDGANAEAVVKALLKDGTEYTLSVAPQTNQNSQVVDAVASNHPFKFQIQSFWVESYKRQDPKDLFHPK